MGSKMCIKFGFRNSGATLLRHPSEYQLGALTYV